jgi:hypothetical protein
MRADNFYGTHTTAGAAYRFRGGSSRLQESFLSDWLCLWAIEESDFIAN